jgi:hypothetical protein
LVCNAWYFRISWCKDTFIVFVSQEVYCIFHKKTVEMPVGKNQWCFIRKYIRKITRSFLYFSSVFFLFM